MTKYRTSSSAIFIRYCTVHAALLLLPLFALGQQVYDNAKIFSSSEKERLISSAARLSNAFNAKIVVLTTAQTGSNTLDVYARSTKAYSTLNKNDLMIVLSVDDKDALILTSRNNNEWISDKLKARIRKDYMMPKLEAGHYYSAASIGIEIIAGLASGKYKVSDIGSPPFRLSTTTKAILCWVFLLVIFLFIYFVSPGGRRGGSGYRGGGSYGGFGGGGFGGGSSGGTGGFGGFGGGSFGGGGSGGSW